MIQQNERYANWDHLLRLVACWLSLTVAAFAIPKTWQSDDTPLKLGVPIERELKGGEAHTYRIRLAAGQLLHAVVMQKGIDVEVRLLGADEQTALKVDNPNGSYGAEPVVFVAEVAGDYQLKVIAPNSKAPAGGYEIKIIALRLATSTDREQAAAEKAFQEGQELRSQRTASTRQRAIERYQQALQVFRAAREQSRQALALYVLGVVQMEDGEYRKATEYFNQALTLFRAQADDRQAAETLNFLGGAADLLGEPSQALGYYSQALLLFRNSGNTISEASTLNNLGKVASNTADWLQALGYYNQALPLFRSFGDQRREAITQHNIGVTYNALGEHEQALEVFRSALILRRAASDKVGEADTLSNMGLAYVWLGQPREAIKQYEQALPLRRAANDRNGEGVTLNYLGLAYAALNEPEQALAQLQQSLKLRRAVEDRRGEAVTLGNLGQVYLLLGQPPQALVHYQQALAIFRNLGDRNNEARMLQGLARAESAFGDLAAARQHVEAAITLFEDVRRTGVTSPQLRASYLATQQNAYQFYLDLLMQQHRAQPNAGLDALALQTSERSRARSLLEVLSEARADIRQGVDAKLLARERELAQQLNAKAERMTQRNTPAQFEALKKEVSQLEIEHEQVQSDIRKDNPRYAAITQPQPLGLKEIQQQVLNKDVLLLEYALGEERSYLWAVTQDSITSYELPKRELIEKAAKQVTELLTARSVRQRTETPPQRTQRIAEADAQLPEAAKQLSEMVLAPAAAQLAGNRLLIVADGALQYVPFAMLPITTGKGDTVPLVVQNEIVTLPSASTLAVMRRELNGRQPAPKMLAVFADPVFAGDDERGKMGTIQPGNRPGGKGGVKVQAPEAIASGRSIVHEEEKSSGIAGGKLLIPRLPYTRQEADRILAVTPNTANLKAVDFRASRALATGAELGQYRYLHFATHGLLDAKNPKLSALVLSLVDEQGKPQDGFLRAHEIYNLNLPAELVVLSACQTGLGKEYKGEGLVGLTRGFMYAGAARVMVSLWNVNDKATADLMAKFYQRMLKDGQRPAEALRSAQVEMWRQKQWQAPYYWAAFVLQGEWK